MADQQYTHSVGETALADPKRLKESVEAWVDVVDLGTARVGDIARGLQVPEEVVSDIVSSSNRIVAGNDGSLWAQRPAPAPSASAPAAVVDASERPGRLLADSAPARSKSAARSKQSAVKFDSGPAAAYHHTQSADTGIGV